FSILLESSAMPIERFTAQVEMIKDLTHDVRQLDLRLIEPKTIVFKPGQFISFEMPHPRTGHLVTRAYSIASQPSRSDVITPLFNLAPGYCSISMQGRRHTSKGRLEIFIYERI